jgi:hypothetical protein
MQMKSQSYTYKHTHIHSNTERNNPSQFMRWLCRLVWHAWPGDVRILGENFFYFHFSLHLQLQRYATKKFMFFRI